MAGDAVILPDKAIEASSLSDMYGHEENLSLAIANSSAFRELLNACGFELTECASLEMRVQYGHKGREGRIDILQPTTGGLVIVEVQYGISDSSHALRLQNYAKNFRDPAFVLWIAEGFRDEHLSVFEQAKVPVLCARICHDKHGLTLHKASPIRWTRQTQAKRERDGRKKCLALAARLFSESQSRLTFKPMQSFFGQAQGRYAGRLMAEPKNKPWNFEANVAAIIEWYLKGLPRKSQFYLLKHPSFLATKEQMKDEMAAYWMLMNQGNDHPYQDATCAEEPHVGHDHPSRDGRWSSNGYFFAYQRLRSPDRYAALFRIQELAEILEEEQRTGYSKGKNASVLEYRWESMRQNLLDKLDVFVPAQDRDLITFDQYKKVEIYKQISWRQQLNNPDFPLDDKLYRSWKEDLQSYAEYVFTGKHA